LKYFVQLITLLLVTGQSQLYTSQDTTSNWHKGSIILIAHRGGIVPDIPENSLSAFQNAIEKGAHAIEIDLRATKDGEIVIMHDETVDRTTNGNGRVSDLTLVELKKLDLGNGERIPTYEEVLQFVSGTGVVLLLDIKESPVLDKRSIVQQTEKHNAILNVIIGVRNLEDLNAFQAFNPNLRLLGFIQEVRDIEAFVNAGVDIIRLWPKWIYADEKLIQKVHLYGKSVWTTAGDIQRDELENLINLGVNGILLDRMNLMKLIIDDMNKNHGLK